MKTKKEEIPITMESLGATMRALPGYGGMTVAFNELPAGTDLTPLLEGLENNNCHCSHWGYIIQGDILIKYTDGSEERLTTGEVFYLPPGHTAFEEKDLKILDFSPEKEFNEVMQHIGAKLHKD
jgi:hypothetical protein